MRQPISQPARGAILATCLGAITFLGGGRGIADTQTFQLAPQWNLISFQVVPNAPEPAEVFGTLPGFISAWGYDGATGLWQRYVQPQGDATAQQNTRNANQLLRLPPIRPGRGYWVQVQAATTWSVEGTPPRGLDFPSLELNPGWHLIGIPVGEVQVETEEPVSLLAVLSAAGFDYDALVTWDQNYRKMFRPQGGDDHPLVGLPADPPFPGFRLQQDLGRGYWVHVVDPAVLRPRLVTTLRPDMDIPPRGNFPSKEDQNVSGATSSAQLKSVQNQDVIRFFPGEDVQMIGIANLGESDQASGGILLWEVVWEPATDRSTPEPWIRLVGSRDQRERRDANGQLTADYTRLSGVTTIEHDVVYLRLDRRNLGRGIHEGTVTVRTTVGDRSFRVIAEVPGVEGDFSGYAVIRTVNGRHNPVPDIDLPITLYEDQAVPGLLRGYIDSSRALLWPVDVPFIGHRSANEGNRFLLGGSFVLPPGDQNGEPYDQWDEDKPEAGEDADWLNDGTLEVRNPFPFPLQRTVLLEGALVSGNPTDGYVIEGTYREVVHGMSRVPLELEGSFRLDRQAARPFSQRRVITGDTGVEPVVMTNRAVAISIPPGQARTSAITITTELALHSLQAAVQLSGGSGALTHSNLVLTLRSPGPDARELLLYDGSNPSTAVSAGELGEINFPLNRPPAGDLDRFLAELPRTRTDASNSQFWELVVRNTGADAVTFVRWSLRLEGQPVTDVQGVVRAGDAPLPGAVVSLDGLPLSLNSAPTDAEGRFELKRVPLLPLNFTARRPGYAPPPTNAGLDRAFTTPFGTEPKDGFTAFEQRLMARFNPLAGAPPQALGVSGFNSGNADQPFALRLDAVQPSPASQPSIIAGPLEAFVGSAVEFAALDAASSVRWEFGDGSSRSEPFITHVFSGPGAYEVKLYSPEGEATPQATVQVVVLAAPSQIGANSGSSFVFQASRSFGGVATDDIAPKSDFDEGETNKLGAVLVARLPLQHTYAASMDMDLAPGTDPAATERTFAVDGFTALPEPNFNTQVNSNSFGFKDEDFNYALLGEADEEEYPDLDEQNNPIIWGNPLETPKINYASLEATDRNGFSFRVSADDNVFHPHVGSSTFEDLEPHAVVTHYRIACNVGAQIVTASIPSAAIRPAKARRGAPDDPLAAALLPAQAGLARNLYYQLHLTPLPVE